MADLTVTELVRQGSAAARAGNAPAARDFFQRAIDRDGHNTEAWLGMCGLVATPEEKRRCFQRILEWEPGNPEALAGLNWLTPAAERVSPAAAPAEPPVLYCANHPNVETVLRCNRCGKPICTKCAIRTPVGYRCPECVRQQQSVYFTARSYDYPIAGVITLVLTAIAGFFVPLLLSAVGFYGLILTIFVSPAVAGVIAELIRRTVGRRRGRYLWVVVCGTGIAGSLIGFLALFLFRGAGALLTALIYVVILVSTLYARTR